MPKTSFQNSIDKMHGSLVWTHKIQRTYLEILENRRKILRIIKIIFTAVASLVTVSFAIFNNQIGTITSSIVTIATIFLADILDKIETKENIQLFKDSSTRLFELRNQLVILKDKILTNKINDGLVEAKLESINEIYAASQRNLPTIPNKVVMKASSKLEDRKDEETGFKLL